MKNTDPPPLPTADQTRMSQLVQEANAIYDMLPAYQKERTSGQNVLDTLIALDGVATIWPILRVQVVDMVGGGSRIAASMLFAPGLPAGDHDLYPARVRPAAPHEDTQLLDYVLPLVANYAGGGDSAVEREIDARLHCLQGMSIRGLRGRDAIRSAIHLLPPRTTP